VNLSLGERAELARRAGAAVFVSIHASEGTGHDLAIVHRRAGASSRRLADGLAADVLAADMAVLTPERHARDTAACLLELDSLSRDPRRLDDTSRAIASGIQRYLGSATAVAAEDTPPGYLEEGGFGSLKQLQKNRKEYEDNPENHKIVKVDDEYVPDLGAPEHQRTDVSPEEIGRLDLDDVLEVNQLLRERIETTATKLDLDPGLLAATLFAEDSRASVWAQKSGKVASELLGLDDWFDDVMARYIKKVIAAHADLDFAYSDVAATGASWDTSTEKKGGGMKPRGKLDAKKAVMAVAVYQKAQEAVLLRKIANEQKLDTSLPELATFQPDQRLTVLRVAFNAGVGRGYKLYAKIAQGGDIPRTGGTQRNPDDPERTAVLHVARAIHLDQAVFGRSNRSYQP
jgi:hypothetical protein